MKDFKTKNGFFTGNVGIGTTNPDSIAHLSPASGNKGLRVDVPTNSTAPAVQIRYNNVVKAQLLANGDSYFNGGNVGIGTTSPGEMLVIQDSSNPTLQIRDGDQGSASARTAGTLHLGETAALGVAIENYTHGFNDVCSMIFKTTAAAGSMTERMRISTDGNVGIGTTNPSASLHIADAAEPNLLIQRTAPNGNVSGLTLNSVGGTGINNRRADISLMIADSTGNSEPILKFSTTNGASPGKDTMSITNGSVGIGTTNPNSKLTVEGAETGVNLLATNNDASIKIRNTSDTDGNFASLDFYNSTNFNTARVGANFIDAGDRDTALYFATRKNGGGLVRQMIIDEDGKVGIGTTSPAVKLEVVNSGSSNIAQFSSTSSNLGGYILIQGSSEAGSAGNLFFGNGRTLVTGSSDASAAIRASTELLFSIGAAEKMRISSGGNVGIGTTNPSAQLHIENTNANTPGIKIRASDQNYEHEVKANGDGLLLSADSTNYGGAGPDIRFNVSGSERMRIQKSGNVGIGITTPSCKLFVASSSNDFVTKIRNDRATTAYGILTSLDNASASTSGGDHLRCATGGVIRLKIYADGSVQNTTNVYGQLSDIKLKENVADATPKLDDLNKVRVVNFNLKGDDVKQIGVIAQELEEIFPGLVDDVQDHDENGNLLETTTKSVKYSVFGPILIKAIQEQQTIIEDLKARIETLES
jgi:hypothetical protein